MKSKSEAQLELLLDIKHHLFFIHSEYIGFTKLSPGPEKYGEHGNGGTGKVGTHTLGVKKIVIEFLLSFSDY